MTNQEIMDLDKEFIIPTYARFPIAIERYKGALAYDFEGREYVDFTSGIGVNSIGGGNPHWIKAINTQAEKLAHMSNLFYTEPCANLAKRLCLSTGMDSAFFCNSGAEANEALIKLARKYSFDKYGANSNRNVIATLKNSFHGRTMATITATGQDSFHNYFFPFLEGFRYVEANNLDDLKEACSSGDVCALLIETIQGEGGVLPLKDKYVIDACNFCHDNDILFLIDEVQTGIGRTGKLFSFQTYNTKPDAISFAKGIAGGLPFGGILVSNKLKGVFTPSTHGSTFGGNPICAAAANATLDIVEEALPQINEKGQYIKNRIESIKSPYLGDVCGRGLMLGVQIHTLSHKELAAKFIENGLLVLTAGKDRIRLLPPLNISYDEIEKGLIAFELTMKGI